MLKRSFTSTVDHQPSELIENKRMNHWVIGVITKIATPVLLIVIVGINLSTKAALAEPNPSNPTLSAIAATPKQLRTAQNPPPSRFPPTPLGTRGSICAISLAGWGSPSVWSDRPLFLWQGSSNRLVVRDFETDAVMWEQALSEDQQQILYNGLPLEPGKRYSWRLDPATVRPGDAAAQDYIFEVLATPERTTINQDLQNLESQLSRQGETANAMLLAKVDYFISKNLFSDALRLLFTVSNPSPEVLQEQQAARLQCSSQGDF